MASSTSRNRAAERSRVAAEIEALGSVCQFSCRRCFRKGVSCIMSDRRVGCVECSRAGKRCIDVSWSELDKTRGDTSRQLERALDDLEKAQAKVARLRRTLKRAQRRAQDKTICLAEELNKETDERIARGDVSEGEAEDLAAEEAEQASWRRLAAMSPSQINWELGDVALVPAPTTRASSSQGS